jgi:hypothetical protein
MSNRSVQKPKVRELLDELLRLLKKDIGSTEENKAPASPIKPQPLKQLGDPIEIAKQFNLSYYTDLSEFRFIKEKITPLPYSLLKLIASFL